MKKIYILLLTGILSSATVICQEEDFFSAESNNKQETEKPRRSLDKWSIGGNFGGGIGSSRSFISLTPVFLYRPHPRLMVGPGFTYVYENNKYWGYETSTYGPKAMAMYSLFTNLDELLNINIGNIVLQTEYEALNLEKIYLTNGGLLIKDGRIWVHGLLAGGGIFVPFGNRGGFSFVVLYNFLESEFSPYSNPDIRVGFYF